MGALLGHNDIHAWDAAKNHVWVCGLSTAWVCFDDCGLCFHRRPLRHLRPELPPVTMLVFEGCAAARPRQMWVTMLPFKAVESYGPEQQLGPCLGLWPRHSQGLHWYLRFLLPLKTVGMPRVWVSTWEYVGIWEPCCRRAHADQSDPHCQPGSIAKSGHACYQGPCLGPWSYTTVSICVDSHGPCCH